MLEIRKPKVLMFLCVLFVLVFVIGAFLLFEKQYCMEVPIVGEEKFLAYTNDLSIDITQLRFNNREIAADIAENTIYISQATDKISHYTAFQGKLDSKNPNYSLFFLKNVAMDDVSSAICGGAPLTLAIVCGDTYRFVDVIITTLPVINMSGEQTHLNEDGRAVFSGSATLWAGRSAPENAYFTTSSDLQWHIRGNSTALEPKNSWKLSFKDENGGNRDLDLLGLGKDDDWILNSLTMDDTRIREKLFMDLWNTITAETDHNYKMSSGGYVEVVLGGKYMGLFLLQRRLDAKYLELSDEDVLLKVTHYQPASVEEAYEFVTPTADPEKIYAMMQGVFDGTDVSRYNLDNIADTNLMLQMTCALDNVSFKNMYIVLNKNHDDYTVFFVPWDTDMSFGVVWKDGIGFCYDYRLTMDVYPVRIETDSILRACPEYQETVSQNWKYLRKTVLTENKILAHIDELYHRLDASGALTRDISLWSNRYGEADTVDALRKYIRERLAVMDMMYS